jgi:hypothetical protein
MCFIFLDSRMGGGSLALPAFRSLLENRVELQPLTDFKEELALADFYLAEARRRAERDPTFSGEKNHYYDNQPNNGNLHLKPRTGLHRSGRASRQDWPEYCLFILAWFPPRLVTHASDLAE